MDTKTVEYVAKLARLQLSTVEVEGLKEDLNRILSYADQLSNLSTDQVEPLAHPGDILNSLREDRVEPSTERSTLQRNAPASDGEFYLVPAVLGDSGKETGNTDQPDSKPS